MPKKFNPNDDRQLGRLNEAREYSRRRLQPYRENRFEAIRQMVGTNWSDYGADDRVPINFVDMAVNIYRRFLAARNPQVLVTTEHKKLRAQSLDFEIVMNHSLEEIWFEQSLYRWVTDAMFAHGILKVGITETASDEESWLHDSGQPFADAVDLDDWNHDMTVKRWEQIGFAENRYRLPLEYVKESKLYKNTDQLRMHSGTDISQRHVNETGDERVEALGGTHTAMVEEYRDTVELWDTWLPREQMIITTVATHDGRHDGMKPIRVVEWTGPEMGPYHRLTFQEVPNNTMPLPPIMLLIDLHMLGNQLFRKLGRQALRQKKINTFRAGGEQDQERINNTGDGEGVRLDQPGDTSEMNFGGIDQTNLAFFLQVRDLFVYLGGNLDALGGLSAQASTLGQEEIIAQGAGARLMEWRDRTEKATKRVVESIGDYVWNDPNRDDEYRREIPGTGVEVDVKFSEETREGDFLDYNIDIQPYSMQERTPADRLAQIATALERYYIPLSAQFEAAGFVVNPERLFEILAKYGNVPELREIFELQESPEALRGPIMTGDERTRQQPHTSRENVRVNKTEGTRQGRDNALTQLLAGGGSGDQSAGVTGLPS